MADLATWPIRPGRSAPSRVERRPPCRSSPASSRRQPGAGSAHPEHLGAGRRSDRPTSPSSGPEHSTAWRGRTSSGQGCRLLPARRPLASPPSMDSAHVMHSMRTLRRSQGATAAFTPRSDQRHVEPVGVHVPTIRRGSHPVRGGAPPTSDTPATQDTDCTTAGPERSTRHAPGRTTRSDLGTLRRPSIPRRDRSLRAVQAGHRPSGLRDRHAHPPSAPLRRRGSAAIDASTPRIAADPNRPPDRPPGAD